MKPANTGMRPAVTRSGRFYGTRTAMCKRPPDKRLTRQKGAGSRGVEPLRAARPNRVQKMRIICGKQEQKSLYSVY